MAAAAFFGYALLGLAPGIVFYAFFIAPKSFVVLVTLFSSFYWLLVLLITSSVLVGFVPIRPTVGPYAGVLVAAVCIEEVARYGVWIMHRRTMQQLEAMSRASGHEFSSLDRLYLALGWGYGHGACHVLFFFASLLPLTAGHGTYYQPLCPAMSVFLVGALQALGFGAMLAAAMVVALDGWRAASLPHAAGAPLVHLLTALVTLINLRPNGCLYAVPAVLAIGVATTVYAGHLAWRQGVPASQTERRSTR